MSVRKKPEKAVPVLIDQLSNLKRHILKMIKMSHSDISDLVGRQDSKLDKIEEELMKMSESMSKIKEWEKNVIEKFCELERLLDEARAHKSLDDVRHILKRIEPGVESLNKSITSENKLVTVRIDALGPEKQQNEVGLGESVPEERGGQTVSEVWASLGVEEEIMNDKAMLRLLESIHCPENPHLRKCLLWLSVFPEKRLIKKRPLIYWWMGEGLVSNEEEGECVLRKLLGQDFIIKNKQGGGFSLCPWVRRLLIPLAQKHGFFKFRLLKEGGRPRNGNRRAFLPMGKYEHDDALTVFNIDEQSLVGTELEWLRKQKRLEVLQMGQWQDSVTHHIQAAADKYEQLLDAALTSKKHLKYLSLRGISGIETLPTAPIGKLVSLRILDVRACHNLERLPKTISKLRNLTHLDVSECYLLEGMPEGLHLLLNLQVLKGFVVGRDSSEIARLSKLEHLTKLSIRVRREGGRKLRCLKNFSALCILTILWMGDADPNTDVADVTLPAKLTSLDLQSVPFKELPKWLEPSELPNLKKLRIKGGNLRELVNNNHVYSTVESLRLQCLAELRIKEYQLVALFPKYLYLEKTKCYNKDEDHPDITLKREISVSQPGNH